MKLLILGAGGYGQTVVDVAFQLNKFDEIAFLDDKATGEKVLGVCSDYKKFKEWNIYPAFGNNTSRIEWIERLQNEQISIPQIIHPTAYVSPTAKLGIGNVVLPNAIINTNCSIGNGCIINCGSIIDHDCVIEDGVHICLGAIIKAENRIKKCDKIEAGEVIQARTLPL